MRHVKVLEAQVERDSDLDRCFEELAARLEQRIDDGIEEIETSLGLLIESINELSGSVREIARTLARLAEINGLQVGLTSAEDDWRCGGR
jgi:hypothetical protein